MATQAQAASQIECDLLVIGSGAGGLSAAVTAAWHGLKVIVAEKEPVLGGTTAWSGGWMWAPCNPLAQRAGIVEDAGGAARLSAPCARQQFRRGQGRRLPRRRAAHGRLLRDRTPRCSSRAAKIPDTYGDAPGAGTGGRSVIAAPYDARGLGISLTSAPADARDDLHGHDHSGWAGPRGVHERDPLAARLPHAAGRFGRHLIDLALHRRGMQLRNGLALVGRLLRSAADLGVELRTSSPAVRLLQKAAPCVEPCWGRRRARRRSAHGAASCSRPAASRTIPSAAARCSPPTSEHLTVAVPPPQATACASASPRAARWTTRWPHPGAWCPVSLVPFADGTMGRFPHIIERNKPGIIGVLADGRRFCNEGNGYHDYVAAMLRAVPPGQEVASWLVCTRAFQRRYGLGIARPTPLPVGPYIRSGYLKTGRTIAELARNCGIDPEGLERTVTDYNAQRPPRRGPRVRPRQHALQSPERRSGQHAQSCASRRSSADRSSRSRWCR